MSFALATILTLVGIVQQVASEVGIPENYMCKIAKIESNWKPNASNKGTNAKGLFQITKPTEASLRAKYKIEGDIFSPEVNSKLAALLTKEHINYLGRKGFEANYLNLYIIHFFGIPTGYRFLTTSNDTIVRKEFPREYKYNKSMIGNKTVGELKLFILEKLNKAENCNEIKDI